MGKERVKKARLLLHHISLAMLHTSSVHFPLVSSSHMVLYLCQENWGIELRAGWAPPSITCMLQKVKVKGLVAPLCPTLCDPMDCSPPGSAVHGILQAKILEWVAIPFCRGSSPPRDQTQVSHITSRFFTIWITREAPFFFHDGTSNIWMKLLFPYPIIPFQVN